MVRCRLHECVFTGAAGYGAAAAGKLIDSNT